MTFFISVDKDQLYRQQPIENTLVRDEEIVQERTPLTLDIKDQDACESIDRWIKESRQFFKEKYNLYDRRKKNETVLFGRQLEEKEKQRLLKVYEARYLDNAIYEIEASLKPLAMSRLPDMIVMPGNNSEESRKVAQDITKVIDQDIKKRENRMALSLGFKHLPVYFTGIIKVKWDPEKNDYVFFNVHPELVDVDQTTNSKDADKMTWISETLPITVQMCIMKFPKKKAELFAQLRLDGLDIGEKDEEPKYKALMSEIKIKEVWYDWYEKKGEGENEEWEKTSCVMWKYKSIVLENIKNPNFDYEGYSKYVSHDPMTNNKREVTDEEMMTVMMTGQVPPTISKDLIYRNFFDRPRKPYFFFGYDQWGKIPFDETSRIEQNIRNQENLDRTGKSIIDKLSARVKHIFSKDGGLAKEDIEQMDVADPMQDILVEGDVNKVHAAIEPEKPSPQEFNELGMTRQRMYSLAGANAIRGEVQSDTATSSQIAREADFTRADDLVEDTIAEASEWMSQWALHMIKLRYTEDHFSKMSGARGRVTFIKLNRDMIEDGMEVHIKSSGTDKLQVRKQAMELAANKMIDPLTLFRDMGLEDPEGRTEDLLLSQLDPVSYLAKVKGLGATTPELINTLMGSAGGSTNTNAPTAPLSPSTTVTGVQATGQPPSPISAEGVKPIPTGPPQGSARVL